MTALFQQYVAPARARPAVWRTALGVCLCLAVYAAINGAVFAALAVMLGPGGLDGAVAGDAAQAGATPWTALALLATFVPLALGVVLAAAVLHRRGPETLLGEGWLPDALRGVLAVALLYGLSILLASLGPEAAGSTPTPNVGLVLWLQLLPLALALVAIQTLAEELFFRGYLMQQIAARTGSVLAALWGPAILFAAAHAAPASFGTAWPLPVAAALLFGLIAGDLTRRHGNLGAAWGLHFANNTAALLVMAAPGPLSGLALYLSPYDMADLMAEPWRALGQLVPLLLAWAVLRRPTRA